MREVSGEVFFINKIFHFRHLNISRHVSLPFQFSLSLLDHDGHLPVVFHEVREALAKLDVLLGRVGLGGLNIIEVSSEDYQHVVLGDVILDLGLEESLTIRQKLKPLRQVRQLPEQRRP